MSLPSRWELLVPIDEKSPPEERYDHLRAIATHLQDMTRSELRKYSGEADSIVHSVVARLPHIYADIAGIYKKEGSVGGSVAASFIRMVKMKMKMKMKMKVDAWTDQLVPWDAVAWEDVEPVYKSLGADERYEPLFRLARLLLGQGVHNYHDYPMPHCRITPDGPVIREYAEDVLYTRLLASFPEDIDPVLFGLGPVVGEYGCKYRPTSTNPAGPLVVTAGTLGLSVSSLVPWLHYQSLMWMEWSKDIKGRHDSLEHVPERVTLPQDKFALVIEVISDTLGVYAMKRMLSSLTLNKDKYERTNRIETFCTSLEYFIKMYEEGPENLHGFLQLPSSRVASVKKYK